MIPPVTILLITGISGRRSEIKKAPTPKYKIFSFVVNVLPAGSSNSNDRIHGICRKNTGLNLIGNNLLFLPKLYSGKTATSGTIEGKQLKNKDP
jgi:hypothetical protein